MRSMPVRNTAAGAAALLLVGAALASGCGSSFSTCEDTRTCGTAPDASGGANSTDGGTRCSSPSDCDDHLACNGQEQCVEGRCVAGVAVACSNPDPAHCVVKGCVEAEGGAKCEIQAADRDGDGYGSAACAAAPGTDCDDGDKNVHPGAQEVCDGVDNDCNGKADLDDGLALTGKAQKLVAVSGNAREPALSWSPDAGYYGVVWDDDHSGHFQVYYGMMSKAGTMSASSIGRLDPTTSDQSTPRIAWGGTRFGVVWRDEAQGSVVFQAVDSLGLPDMPAKPLGTGAGNSYTPEIIWDPTQTHWVVFWQVDPGSIQAQAVALDGTLGKLVTVDPTGAQYGAGPIRAALSATTIGVAWEHLATSQQTSSFVRFARLTSALGVVGVSDIPDSTPLTGQVNSSPQLAATPGGLALLWSPATSFIDTTNSYEELKNDGTTACGPVSLKNEYVFGTSLVAYPGGTVVFTPHVTAESPPQGQIVLQRIAPGCAPAGGPVAVAPPFQALVSPTAAVYVDGTGFGVVWSQQDTTTQQYQLWSRTFGPLFCN